MITKGEKKISVCFHFYFHSSRKKKKQDSSYVCLVGFYALRNQKRTWWYLCFACIHAIVNKYICTKYYESVRIFLLLTNTIWLCVSNTHKLLQSYKLEISWDEACNEKFYSDNVLCMSCVGRYVLERVMGTSL